MNTPLISIIVPIYNVEPYLRKCLESINKQVYTYWEAILVDDGSRDCSHIICDEFAAKDRRFHVIHKPNGGVSSARNRGIAEAKGIYICFVDSDDWLEPTFLQNFMEVAPHKYGAVLQSFCYDYEKTGVSSSHILPKNKIIKSSELVCFLENTDGVHNGYLWHRLFRLETIINNNLTFVEGLSFAEDGLFFLNYILCSENFIVTEKIGYHHLIRNNSLTSKGKTLPRQIYFYLLEHYIDLIHEIIRKDTPDSKVTNVLKLYIWRLIYNWMLKRSVNCKEDFFTNITFLSNTNLRYNIFNDVHTSSFALTKIIEIASKRPTTYRYYEFCLFVVLYYVNNRIKGMLKKYRKLCNGYNR